MSHLDESLLFRLMKEIHDLRDEVQTMKDRNLIKLALPEYKPCLRYGNDIPLERPLLKNNYLLITCTFDPKISVNLDEIGQNLLLKRALDELQNVEYYACFEKHKSGILHSHIIANVSTYDMEYKYGLRMLKHISKSINLHPSINFKNIKKTEIDYERSFNYIIDDKPDHPIYKKYHFNTDKLT